MTENKRFWILNTLTEYSGIKDKDKLLTFDEVVDLLNEQHDKLRNCEDARASYKQDFMKLIARKLNV